MGKEQFEAGKMEISKKVTDIKSVGESYNQPLIDRTAIERFVEEPLVEGCQILYDRNIQTVGSSANMEDGKDTASVLISWDSLSEENRRIAEKRGLKPSESGWKNPKEIVSLKKLINEGSTVEDISSYFVAEADQYVIQEPTWIPRYSIEDLKNICGVSNDKDVGPESFQGEGGYYYDPESQTFYESEDHFRKVKDWEVKQKEK